MANPRRPLLSNKDATALYMEASRIKNIDPQLAAAYCRQILRSNPTRSKEIPSKEDSTFEVVVWSQFKLASLTHQIKLPPEQTDLSHSCPDTALRYLSVHTSDDRRALCLWSDIFTTYPEHACAPYAICEASLFHSKNSSTKTVIPALRTLRERYPEHPAAILAQFQLGLLILNGKTIAIEQDFVPFKRPIGWNQYAQAAALFHCVLVRVKNMRLFPANPLDNYRTLYLDAVEKQAKEELNKLVSEHKIPPLSTREIPSLSTRASITANPTHTTTPMQATSSSDPFSLTIEDPKITNYRRMIANNKSSPNPEYFLAKLYLAEYFSQSILHNKESAKNTDFFNGQIPTHARVGQAAALYREIIQQAPGYKNHANNNTIILAFFALITFIAEKRVSAIIEDFTTEFGKTTSRMPQTIPEQMAALARLALSTPLNLDIEETAEEKTIKEARKAYTNMRNLIAQLFQQDMITILATDYSPAEREVIDKLPIMTDQEKRHKKMVICAALYRATLDITPTDTEATYQLALLLINEGIPLPSDDDFKRKFPDLPTDPMKQAAYLLRSILVFEPTHINARITLAELIIDKKINGIESDFPIEERKTLFSSIIAYPAEEQAATLYRQVLKQDNQNIEIKFRLMLMILREETAPIPSDLGHPLNQPARSINKETYAAQLCRDIITLIGTTLSKDLSPHIQHRIKRVCIDILGNLLREGYAHLRVGDEEFDLNLPADLTAQIKQLSRPLPNARPPVSPPILSMGTGTHSKPQPPSVPKNYTPPAHPSPILPFFADLQRNTAASPRPQQQVSPPVAPASVTPPALPSAQQAKNPSNKRAAEGTLEQQQRRNFTQTASGSPIHTKNRRRPTDYGTRETISAMLAIRDATQLVEIKSEFKPT